MAIKIAIPLVGPSLGESLQTLDRVNKLKTKGVEYLAEARLDLIGPPDFEILQKHSEVPLIATVRHKEQGGRFSSSEKARIKLLQDAVYKRAEYQTQSYLNYRSINVVWW